jgi:hypothetical protein
MAKGGGNPAGVIRHLYLAALNREPTPNEVSAILSKVRMTRGADRDPSAPYCDIFWALLNSAEFLFNH